MREVRRGRSTPAGHSRIGLVFFPAFDWAISPTHPEREERLLYTRDQIFEEGLLDLPEFAEYRPGVATEKDVLRAHVCIPDVSSVCGRPHLISAGGAMAAADAFMRREVDRAAALVRPPGHHAMRIVHGARGFCNINNEAIMVEHIRQSYGEDLKIAFVDTDAHHADGTQDIYYNDPDVLHISIHQDGRTLYPGSGFTDELGGPGAYAMTLNVPLPPRTGDEGLMTAVEQLVLPVLEDFEPDIVINAAGQDNHYTDPITDMRVTARGYARLNSVLSPDILVLQGGYSIEGALPYVNLGILLAMAGMDYSGVREPDYDPGAVRQAPWISPYVERTCKGLLDVWRKRHEVDLGKIFGRGDFYSRRRRLYYDTGGIAEYQDEMIRLCGVCSGYRVIKTTAENSFGGVTSACAVVIPRKACSACRHDGRREFERSRKGSGHDHVYLQDLSTGSFEHEALSIRSRPTWTGKGTPNTARS
ncbi:MAG: histone deacetylase [Firmicutes bacterium]|nr:histone deacetylase [Bacillota bacterium]